MADTHFSALAGELGDDEHDDADLVAAPDEGGDDDGDLAVEEEARIRGWKPLPADPERPQPGEYAGDPSRWRSAADYLQHGDSDNGVLREEVRRLTKQVGRLQQQAVDQQRTVAEQRQAIQDAIALARKADQRGYERAVSELRSRQREAVEQGNLEIFDQVQEEIDAMATERQAPPPPPSPPPPPAAPQMDPAITAFRDANPWFIQDQQARQVMMGHFQLIEVNRADLSLEQQLQEAKSRTAADLPGRIPDMPATRPPADPARRAPGLATPRSGAPARRPGQAADPWTQIEDATERAQARVEFERMRRHDDSLTEGTYIALYLNPRADVLDVRHSQRK